MNSSGYNSAGSELIAAIVSNGHTVTNNTTVLNALPAGLTTTCVDPVNGYDWLCFFGTNNFTALTPGIQAFIDLGGKVFYQYEVSCCTVSANSAASIASSLTGNTIVPNSAPYTALGGWESVGCCLTFVGNAYKCFDGVPAANQLVATADLPGSNPTFSSCSNFGFAFGSTDFVSGANRGGMIGFGDVNIWYSNGEPWSNGGSNPIDMAVVDFIFPNPGSSCFLFPPGCTNSAISANTNSSANVNLGADQSLCSGDTIILDAGSSANSYLWQDNSSNQTFTVTGPGIYSVTASGACGTDNDTIVITEIDPPVLNLGADQILCNGDTILLNPTIQNEQNILWQDGSNDTVYQVTQSGTYWIEISNSCGILRDSVLITDLSTSLNIGADTILCSGDTIILDAGAQNTSVVWQDNSTSQTFTVTEGGNYFVMSNTACGILYDTVFITELFLPNVDLGPDQGLCLDSTLNLNPTINNALNIVWQDGSNNSNYLVDTAGIYWLEADNICGNVRDSILITQSYPPLVFLGNDTTICDNSVLNLNLEFNGANYLWNDGSVQSNLMVDLPGIYYVLVELDNCSASDTIEVLTEECLVILEMPNVFTPNGDETNSMFIPVLKEGIASANITIVNRWHNVVYESNDVSAGWNGTSKGVECTAGTYFWIVDYTDDFGKTSKIHGFVQLIR